MTVRVPALSAVVYRHRAAHGRRRRARAVVQLAERRRRGQRPGRDRGRSPRRRLQAGDRCLPSRRRRAVDRPRHRRQRAVPRLPRRARPGQGHAAGVPRRRQGPRRRPGRGSTGADVGDLPAPGEAGTRPRSGRASRPRSPIPGSHGSASSSTTDGGTDPGDWDPACEQAQLALDADDDIWKKAAVLDLRGAPSRPRSTGRGTRTTGAGAATGATSRHRAGGRSTSTTTTGPTGSQRRAERDRHRRRLVPVGDGMSCRLGPDLHAGLAAGPNDDDV